MKKEINMLSCNMVMVGGKIRGGVSVFKTSTGKEIGSMVIEVVSTYQKDGQEIERITPVEVKFFGRQIEAYKEKFQDGAQVLVEGEESAYVNKEGKVYNSVVCKHAHFVGPPNKAAGYKRENNAEPPPPSKEQEETTPF